MAFKNEICRIYSGQVKETGRHDVEMKAPRVGLEPTTFRLTAERSTS